MDRAAAGECALVSTYSSGTIIFIDTKTNAVSRTVVLPPASQFFCNLEPMPREVFRSGLALTPDGTRAYIKTGACAALRLDTRTLETAFILGGRSFLNQGGVVITPDGRFAYLTDFPSDSVLVLDIAVDEFITTIPVARPPTDLAITPDGRFVYVVSANQVVPGSGLVSVIDTGSNMVSTTITVGSVPAGLTFSRDGTVAYVANGYSDSISVINTATNEVIGSVPTPPFPAFPTLSPNGETLYFADGDGVVALNLASQTMIATSPLTPGRNAITRDGTALYMVDVEAEAVSVIDTRTLSLTSTIPLPSRACGREVCEPNWITIGPVPGGCPPCPGDCDGDEKVPINELITGVNIALGRSSR